MKKLTSLLPSLFLCLSLLPSALAAQAPAPAAEFSDVPQDSWFQRGVATCAQGGIMVGTGEGLFSPERELTQAECLTLAYRLYDLSHGGDGSLLPAPEDWGKMTYTLSDGTVFEGYGYQSGIGDSFGWWYWPKNGVAGAYVHVPGGYDYDSEDGSAGQRAWMEEHREACGSTAPATLTLNGETYRGTVWCWMPTGPYVLMFQPQDREVNDLLRHAVCQEVGPDRWWRDVCYTIQRKGLEDVFQVTEFSDLPADRRFFAQALAAAGIPDRLFSVESLPDLLREGSEDIYALYEAGILTGTDEFGAFQPGKTLTRSEAAVMAARMLDPDQRAQTAPQAPTYDQSLSRLLRDERFSVTQRLESPYCTILLGYETLPGGQQSYHLRMVCKAGGARPEGFVEKRELPSTVSEPDGQGGFLYYTHRPPDALVLTKNGRHLIYTYQTEDSSGASMLRVEMLDLKEGTFTDHAPFAVEYLSQGVTVEDVLEDESTTVLLAYDEPYGVRDYTLYVVDKESGAVHTALLPSTLALEREDGSVYAPTHIPPNTLNLCDGLQYTYRLEDRLEKNGVEYHKAGIYSYQASTLPAGSSCMGAYRSPLSYADALSEVWPGDESIQRQLETDQCLIFMYTGENRHAPAPTLISVLFKPGSAVGEGVYLSLPVLDADYYPGGIYPPDVFELSPDQRKLTYSYDLAQPSTYQVVGDEPEEHIFRQAGKYTYTLDLMTGRYEMDYTPPET